MSLHDCPHRRLRFAAAARGLVVALCAGLACALAAAPSASAAAGAPSAAATLEVSFDRAAAVRLRGQRFVSLAGADVGAVNDAVALDPAARIERLFDDSEGSLDAARGRLLRAGARNVPDLNRHFRIRTRDAAARDDVLHALRALAVVDEAAAEPRPLPPPSGDYTGDQRYATAAPVGIGTAGTAARPGGLGQNTKIVDVEYSWNRAHEDLAKVAPDAVLIPNGTPKDFFENDNHGTAVLGQLIGTPGNGFGVSGLAPGSAIGLVNAYTTTGYALANAVDLARQNLAAGDVMLVEQQADGPGAGSDFVPVEHHVAVYDAIRLATQSGIIVVEAAGNGGVNLDTAFPQGFPGGRPDSGAIIVGAGSGDATCSGPPANARVSDSTFGTRVNLQGWGRCVTTTGYGGLFDGGPNALYTASFNSTSSASAIVAAAAAVYSSVFQAAAAGTAPTPLAVRRRLAATGSPQAGSPAGNIGPLPNVDAATTDFDFTPPTVTVTGPAGPTNDTTPSFTFTAGEPGAAFECRRSAVAAFAPCGSPQSFGTMSNGEAGYLEVRATDAALNTGPSVARSFTVDTVAPAASISSGPPGLSNDPTPTFAFSSDDPAATFECRAGTAGAPGSFAPCGSPHTTPALLDGSHAFDVRAVDAAGNAGAPATHPFAVDTIAPAVSITDGPVDPTDDQTPTFAFSSSDAVASFECRVGTPPAPGAFAPCGSPFTAPSLPDGPTVFEVRATDPAANTGPVSARAFTIATPPPPPSTQGSGATEGTGTPPPPPALPAVVPVAAPVIGTGTRATVHVTRSGYVQLTSPKISCPAQPPSCTVTVTAHRRAKPTRQIASAKLTIAAGRSASVRFRLTRTARAKLRESRRLVGTVKIVARHGSASRTRTLRVVFER